MSGLGVPETAVEAAERGSAFLFPTSNFGWRFAAQRQARAMQPCLHRGRNLGTSARLSYLSGIAKDKLRHSPFPGISAALLLVALVPSA
jgi:hypothetical protein